MQYDYATLTFLQIRCIAHDLGITVTRAHGKLSARQTWIDAIEAFKATQVMTEAKSMPELPTHAEQEVIAIAADMAITTSLESITESVTTESITSEVGVTDYANLSETIANPELEPATATYRGSKRGAVTVISALVVMVIAAIQAILIGGCEIARLAILFGSMFGKYKPNLDLWHQLQLRVKSSQLSYS